MRALFLCLLLLAASCTSSDTCNKAFADGVQLAASLIDGGAAEDDRFIDKLADVSSRVDLLGCDPIQLSFESIESYSDDRGYDEDQRNFFYPLTVSILDGSLLKETGQ